MYYRLKGSAEYNFEILSLKTTRFRGVSFLLFKLLLAKTLSAKAC